MATPIRDHMAAEGVDADLPTIHRTHLLANNALGLAVLGVAAEVVLNVLDEAGADA